MTRKIYFICSTPGTLGNFLGRNVRALLADENAEIIFSTETNVSASSSEDFYSNITVPETGTFVINCPYRPDFNIMKQRFPDCKIIVITHTLPEITHLSRMFFNSFYVDEYETIAGPHFKKILEDHSWLFSNVNATPLELTRKEVDIFIKIITYHKILDGFHSVIIPNDPNILEVKFSDLVFKIAEVESKLENFIGKTYLESDKAVNREVMALFFNDYFDKIKSIL